MYEINEMSTYVALREKHMLEGALAILSHIVFEVDGVKKLEDLGKVKTDMNDLAKQLSARLATSLQNDLMLYQNYWDIAAPMFESATPQDAQEAPSSE